MSNAYHGQRPPRPAPRPPSPTPAQRVITAMVEVRTATLTPRPNSRGLARADMLRQLEARGIKPAA